MSQVLQGKALARVRLRVFVNQADPFSVATTLVRLSVSPFYRERTTFGRKHVATVVIAHRPVLGADVDDDLIGVSFAHTTFFFYAGDKVRIRLRQTKAQAFSIV